MNDSVILVHGLAAHPLMLSILAGRIRRAGFHVRNWGYPSIWGDIPKHAQRFGKLLQQYETNNEVQRFHLVTHSMGGIVGRRALADFAPEKLKSIVMIAPPNNGSPGGGSIVALVGLDVPPVDGACRHEREFCEHIGQNHPAACRRNRQPVRPRSAGRQHSPARIGRSCCVADRPQLGSTPSRHCRPHGAVLARRNVWS